MQVHPSLKPPLLEFCRDKALATISADGILLVLASMIDNMPYVLAEASVMRIPLLIYDVGGVTEMIDPKLHADIICGTPKVTHPESRNLNLKNFHI